MTTFAPLSFRAPLAEYLAQAEWLLSALLARDESAAWRFKWQHPRFRGRSVRDVTATQLELEDAKLVVALEYAFERWEELERFVAEVARDGAVERFETAVDAVVDGVRPLLEDLLHDDPALARTRSSRRHHATLLHYVAANGVEGARQRTPANAVEIARLLLSAGADPNALADMYDERCTTMSMLVSSSPPAEAGLQAPLAEMLLEHGATLQAPGSKWNATVTTALAFGFLDTARALAAHDGPPSDVAVAAGLGQLGETARLLPTASEERRQIALALACQHGHRRVAQLLLDAGADPNRYNPEGYHAHSTPLHQAVWAGHVDVVHHLVERGARLDVRDSIYDGTPLDWATYGRRDEIADFLRGRADPTESTSSGATS